LQRDSKQKLARMTMVAGVFPLPNVQHGMR
jgi:hypothetical protein